MTVSMSKAQMLDKIIESMGDPTEKKQFANGIIYGPWGVGKTVFAAQIAQAILDWRGVERLGPPEIEVDLEDGKPPITMRAKPQILLIDACNAWRALKNHPELRRNLQTIPWKGKVWFDVLVEAIEFKQPPFDNVEVVILDELSSMTDYDLDVVLEANVQLAKKGKEAKNPDIATQPDMGQSINRMRRSVNTLFRQEVCTLIVSHERNDTDKSVGYDVTRPRFMPKFAGTIGEGLDFMLRMTADMATEDADPYERRRILQCHPTTLVNAKSRVRGLRLKEQPGIFISALVKWLDEDKPEEAPPATLIVETPEPVGEEDKTIDEGFGGFEVGD